MLLAETWVSNGRVGIIFGSVNREFLISEHRCRRALAAGVLVWIDTGVGGCRPFFHTNHNTRLRIRKHTGIEKKMESIIPWRQFNSLSPTWLWQVVWFIRLPPFSCSEIGLASFGGLILFESLRNKGYGQKSDPQHQQQNRFKHYLWILSKSLIQQSSFPNSSSWGNRWCNPNAETVNLFNRL